MSGVPPGTVILCVFEATDDFDVLGPWQFLSPTGVNLAPSNSTPLDPNGPGAFAMGILDNKKIWIAAEAYLWTLNPDLTTSSGGVVFDMFMAGMSGDARYLYVIYHDPAHDSPPRPVYLDEIDPSDWSVVRHLSTVVPLGNVGALGFSNMAVNSDKTILYFTSTQNPTTLASETQTIVHRWDMSTQMPLSDLVSNSVGAGGLIVLPDDTIVVGWTDGAKRYDPDSTLRTTFPRGCLAVEQGLVTRGQTDQTIWIQGAPSSGGYSGLYEYDIDTADELNAFDTPTAGGLHWDAPFCVSRALALSQSPCALHHH